MHCAAFQPRAPSSSKLWQLNRTRLEQLLLARQGQGNSSSSSSIKLHEYNLAAVRTGTQNLARRGEELYECMSVGLLLYQALQSYKFTSAYVA